MGMGRVISTKSVSLVAAFGLCTGAHGLTQILLKILCCCSRAPGPAGGVLNAPPNTPVSLNWICTSPFISDGVSFWAAADATAPLQRLCYLLILISNKVFVIVADYSSESML